MNRRHFLLAGLGASALLASARPVPPVSECGIRAAPRCHRPSSSTTSSALRGTVSTRASCGTSTPTRRHRRQRRRHPDEPADAEPAPPHRIHPAPVLPQRRLRPRGAGPVDQSYVGNACTTWPMACGGLQAGASPSSRPMTRAAGRAPISPPSTCPTATPATGPRPSGLTLNGPASIHLLREDCVEALEAAARDGARR